MKKIALLLLTAMISCKGFALTDPAKGFTLAKLDCDAYNVLGRAEMVYDSANEKIVSTAFSGITTDIENLSMITEPDQHRVIVRGETKAYGTIVLTIDYDFGKGVEAKGISGRMATDLDPIGQTQLSCDISLNQ